MKPLFRAVFLLTFLSFHIPLRAVTISNADLPQSIQSCITGSACFVDNSSWYDSGTATAFQINEIVGGGLESNWLMRYSLVSPSGQSRINPDQSDAFGGYLWMLVKDSYAATETAHPVTLFLDKVTPTPFGMFGQSGTDLSLTMTTADLLAGGGYRTWGLNDSNNDYSYGGLSGDVPVPCVAEGCETHAVLDLVQLSYGDSGSVIKLSFNSSDTRGLVFAQYSTFSCYGDPSCATNDVQSYYVSAVPLPAASWLLVSGIAGLLVAGRHRKRN